MLFDPDKPSNPFAKGCFAALCIYAAVAAGAYVIISILKIGSP